MATAVQDGVNWLGDLVGGSTTSHTTTVTTSGAVPPAVAAAAASSKKALTYIGLSAAALVLIGVTIWIFTGNSKK